jgi:hypothetical protein
MQRLLKIVTIAIVLSGCAPMGASNSGTVRIFPSPLASDSDFINLVNDDRALRDQAFKNVSVYYNCLVKATPDSYQRQDPTVLSRSQIVAFSEIPAKIHDGRMEKLATLVNDQNRSAMQSVIDAEIQDLSRIRWEDIKKEVNSIVAGSRKAELKKNACNLPDSETTPHRVQLVQEWWLLRPVFFAPFM